MSLKTVSNMIYQGDIADLPPLTAPMPANGLYYADFINGVYISNVGNVFYKNKLFGTAMAFSRPSIASVINEYGGLQYAQEGVPRTDRHPVTKKILGFRVENSTTNQAINAVDMTTAAYTAAGLSVSAPSNGWCTLTESSMNELHVLTDTQSQIDTALYNAVSVYAKYISAQYLQIQVVGAGAQAFANFDVRNRKVTRMGQLAVSATASAGFDSSTRCELCVKGNAVATGTVKYSIINDPLAEPGIAYAGSGRAMQLGQAQIEKNTYHASSPFFPDGATGGTTSASRRADNAALLSIPAANQSRFSVFVKGVMPPVEYGNGGGNNIISLLNTSLKKYAGFGLAARTSSYAYRSLVAHNINETSTMTGFPFNGKTYAPYGEYALMLTVDGGTLKVYSGMTDAPETLMTGVPAFDTVTLGGNSIISGTVINLAGLWGAWLQKAVLFDSALSDADMMAQFDLLS
ncbi:TPA: hypothetical protein ACXLLI_002361 [Klebsiella variicola]